MVLLGTLLLAAAPTALRADSVALTRIAVVLDERTWKEVRESEFLPTAFGSGWSVSQLEVRLCDRLTCVVMIKPDSAAGRLPGQVQVGVEPQTGSALATQLSADTTDHSIEIVSRPPPPDYSVPSDSMPMMYFLKSARIALPDSTIRRIAPMLQSAGARVFPEGAGLVVNFPSQQVRLVPDYAGAGIKQLDWQLRREAPGNPTYRFASISRLRFGPGRTATWTFP